LLKLFALCQEFTNSAKKAFPVKRISHRESRKNSASRRRKVAARHGQAGHWSPQPNPMFSSGTIHYEIGANTDAMSYGGMGAVHRLVTKLGLVKQIDERLHLLKMHLPYHESDHVLNLAYNVLCGGTRLEDIERLRHDTAYMNALGADLIPDPTTAGDFCRRFLAAARGDLDGGASMPCGRACGEAVGATCWVRSRTSMRMARLRRRMASRRRGWISRTRGPGVTRP